MVLVLADCFKCLLNPENKDVCASLSGNVYRWINGANLNTPPDPLS